MSNFSNMVIDSVNLPKIEEVNFKKLQKKYISILLLYRLLLLIPIITYCIIHLFTPLPMFEIILGIVLVLWSLITLTGYLGFYKKGYVMREKDISYRKGLLFHKITTIPLSRIQHSELTRNPLERALNIASINIYTAGGSSSDLTIPGLDYKTAENIREFINNQINDESRP